MAPLRSVTDYCEYLFVYGTLRKEYPLELKSRISNLLEFIGEATLEATLFDLGTYPGAIREDRKSEVTGDVFCLQHPEKVFGILDAYEGEEFKREKTVVTLHSGQYVNAWVYWYVADTKDKTRIQDKDYLNYLKSKKNA